MDNNTRPDPTKNLKIGFVVNTLFVVFEFSMGIFANSLALISDAVHNLTDSFSILLSYIASKISKRGATPTKSFGYGRAAILAATINATILLVTSAFVFMEGYKRLKNPEPVYGGLVVIVALIGIVCNGTVALLASRNRKELNSKAVFVSNVMDTLSSVGAVIAGILIVVTKQTWADPLMSFLIGFLLLYASWEIISEAFGILLEGVPKRIDAIKVKDAILGMAKVKDVDDLHIWTMGAGEAAMSCHVIIDNNSTVESAKIVSNVKRLLAKDFNITHATIETRTRRGPHDRERLDEGL